MTGMENCDRILLPLAVSGLYGVALSDSEMRMAKKVVKREPWTKEDIRTLKTLAREKKKTTVIARTLKRTVGATYQQASKLGVTLNSRG
jgi:hypothetical protein